MTDQYLYEMVGKGISDGLGYPFELTFCVCCLKGVGPSPEQAHVHDERTRRLGDRPQSEFRRLLPAL